MENQKFDLNQLSAFDRRLGQLIGLNDCVASGEAVIREVPTLGVGGTETFIVQTVRQLEAGDHVFIEKVSDEGTVRLVLPPRVVAAIVRQREGNITRTRRRNGRAAMEQRMAEGYTPTFGKKGNRRPKGGAA